MRYILYLFTMALLFVGGMMVGNMYLPEHGATLAASVSVPPLNTQNPALAELTLETAGKNLDILNQALQSCPVVVNEEKDRLVNQIRLLLALEDFYIKKAQLELEMAKNTDTNRPTSQFTQAVADYNTAREYAEKLAEELFPQPPATGPAAAEEQPSAEPPAGDEPAVAAAKPGVPPASSAEKPAAKTAEKPA
ncbi:MAG: hypothetical protein MR039_06610 [Elusimicrobia bacterium]|nr:hypothetical protein [Elusimicrobiota bacterium]